MAEKVDPQITDAISQTDVKVVGEAPAEAMAMLYQMTASAVGLAINNAVASQQQMNAISNAATTQAVNKLLNMDASEAIALVKANSGNDIAQQMSTLLAALNSGQQGVKSAGNTPPVTP